MQCDASLFLGCIEVPDSLGFMAKGAKKDVQYPLRLDSDLWTKISNAADRDRRGIAEWMRIALEARADATSEGEPLPLPEFSAKERAILYGDQEARTPRRRDARLGACLRMDNRWHPSQPSSPVPSRRTGPPLDPSSTART
jgi:hypothetical protein